MHLDHKIPWNTAARNFDLKRCNPHRTPQVTDLFSRGLPNQSNDLNHFLRVFIATIREFSTTERSRYPKKLDTPIVESKSLFSDAVLSYPERKCGLGAHSTNSALHNPLSPEHQRIDSWIKRAQYYGLQSEKERRYTTSDGDLADAVKMLIIIAASAASEEDENEKKLAEDALSALLVLSHHCEVPLSSLNALTWGHGFGVQHVAMSALDIYLLINIVDAVKTSRRSADVNTALVMRKPKIGTEERNEVSLSEMNSFISHFCFQSLFNYDFPAQNIPHRAFWAQFGITDDWTINQHQRINTLQARTIEQELGVGDLLAYKRENFQKYLKMCFGILYRYDLLSREWFGDKKTDCFWMSCIVQSMQMWGLKGEDLFRNEEIIGMRFI